MGQYSMVRFGTVHPDPFPLSTVPLLERRVVCQKVVIDVILTGRRKRNIVCMYILEIIKYTFLYFKKMIKYTIFFVNKPNTHELHGGTE